MLKKISFGYTLLIVDSYWRAIKYRNEEESLDHGAFSAFAWIIINVISMVIYLFHFINEADLSTPANYWIARALITIIPFILVVWLVKKIKSGMNETTKNTFERYLLDSKEFKKKYHCKILTYKVLSILFFTSYPIYLVILDFG